MRNGCIISKGGSKYWYHNNIPHREDGPAVESISGYKAWYFEGKRHRIDGHAVEYADGMKFWYYKGKHFDVSSQEEFEKYLKLLAFL